jgi:hypothetical protein
MLQPVVLVPPRRDCRLTPCHRGSSRVFMDGKQIISNPGLHGPIEKCTTVGVTKVGRPSPLPRLDLSRS